MKSLIILVSSSSYSFVCLKSRCSPQRQGYAVENFRCSSYTFSRIGMHKVMHAGNLLSVCPHAIYLEKLKIFPVNLVLAL
jgi:hypothetical protein